MSQYEIGRGNIFSAKYKIEYAIKDKYHSLKLRIYIEKISKRENRENRDRCQLQ